MIAIQSHSDDVTTDDVIDWLFYLGANQMKRLNGNVSMNKATLRINNNFRKCSFWGDLQSYWYRRGYFSLDTNNTGDKYPAIQAYFQKEYQHYINGTGYYLSKLHGINSFCDNDTNKLTNLIKAANAGLHIPDTIITSDIRELKAFAGLYERIITKAIAGNRIEIPVDDSSYINIAVDTALFDREKINNLPDAGNLLPAVFQQYMEKKYELRIFFLHGRCYSMAIFSQLNEGTKIDFRKHDEDAPNRCVPYRLPDGIEEKLVKFMSIVGMNSGSIDMVVTPELDYVFLEVNPVGQLQWLSASCNYDIERQIAKYLLHEY